MHPSTSSSSSSPPAKLARTEAITSSEDAWSTKSTYTRSPAPVRAPLFLSPPDPLLQLAGAASEQPNLPVSEHTLLQLAGLLPENMMIINDADDGNAVMAFATGSRGFVSPDPLLLPPSEPPLPAEDPVLSSGEEDGYSADHNRMSGDNEDDEGWSLESMEERTETQTRMWRRKARQLV
jgi:hypothetical protein